MTRKTRSDYDYEGNKKIAQAKIEGGLSYNEIALNPNLNPNRVSPQRIVEIVEEYKEKFGENFGEIKQAEAF